MTISFSILPVPKWYIADLVGKPLGGGFLATFSSLDHTLLNPVFADPAGLFAWTYQTIPNIGKLGILFDENGAQGPFYFKFDTAVPDNLYYLEVYDADGVLQWTIDKFSPASAGGGSIITTALNLNNLVQNNTFYRNIGTSATPLPKTLKIAPSNHAGLTETVSQLAGSFGSAGSDILFIKNNTTANDQLTFTEFLPIGTNQLTTDVTPVWYLKYTCGNTPSAEVVKCVQFPITSSVQNFNNQVIIGSFWARSNFGINRTLAVNTRQFFGDGAGASPDVINTIQVFTLSNTWTKYSFSGAIPSVSGKTLGGCADDALFLQIQYPFDLDCDIDFALPSLYLGNILPTNDFQTNDRIEAIDNSPRTGDFKISFDNFYYFGWVPLNDGTIGNASSNATTRANKDTFPLFNKIWNNFVSAQQLAPLYDSGGTLVAYGATAEADFISNHSISLTRELGRVIAGISPLVPTHTFTADFTTLRLDVGNTRLFGKGVPVQLSASGGGVLPAGLSSSTIYYAIYVDSTHIQLAATAGEAIAGGPPVGFTNNGSPTLTINAFNTLVGNFAGELFQQATLTGSNLPSHTHDIPLFTAGGPFFTAVGNGTGALGGTTATAPSGSGLPFSYNVLQPVSYQYFYMKL